MKGQDKKIRIQYPTGFSDPEYREGEGFLVSFIYGKHKDAGGYNRLGECTLAVCLVDRAFVAVPISWISIPKPS